MLTDTNALANAANVLLYKILLFNLHEDLAFSCIFDPTKSIDVVSKQHDKALIGISNRMEVKKQFIKQNYDSKFDQLAEDQF